MFSVGNDEAAVHPDKVTEWKVNMTTNEEQSLFETFKVDVVAVEVQANVERRA